jgi:molecular chaperone GrpE
VRLLFVPDEPPEGRDEEKEMKKALQSKLVQEANGDRESPKGEEIQRMQEEVDRLLDLLQQERKKSDDYLNNLKFLQADFENYRKRMDREVREVEEYSTAGLIKDLIPVLDDLELGLASAESTPQTKEFSEGISMVRRRLLTALENEGLEEIASVGKPFDPDLHEAVDKVQGSGKKDIVVEESRKGYLFKGKVLRPSMVKVEMAMKTNNVDETGGSAK